MSDSFEIVVQPPGAAPCRATVTAATTIGELLAARGLGRDLLVFGPDDDTEESEQEVDVAPISHQMTISELGEGTTLCVHCHHCRHVKVLVNYQNHELRREFAPSARVKKVLRWAKRRLRLDDVDADNLGLFLCGSEELIRGTTHLGELAVNECCELCFDLSKDKNIEG